MSKKIVALALGAAMVMVAAGPAWADAFTINSYSVPNGMAATIHDPILSSGQESGLAGAISISVTDNTTNSTSQMTVWCDDIKDFLGTPGSYTLTTLSSDISNADYTSLDTAKVNQVNALLNAELVGLINPNDATASAALQVAIWEVIYEPGDSGYNVTSGTFYITNDGDDLSTVTADANNYLTYITNGTWLPNLSDTVEQFQSASGTDQNLIYLGVTSSGSHQSVPEPGSMLLLACGLVGLGAMRCRQTRLAAAKARG